MKRTSSRPAIVAGLFYPEDKKKLEELTQITKHEDQTNGLILPHGAYDYILEALKAGFSRIIEQNPEVIILSSVTHREPEKALFLPPYDSFESPMGPIKIEQTLLKHIDQTIPEARFFEAPFMEEHSLELLLPLLKKHFPQTLVLPLLFGQDSISLARKTAKSLKKALGNKKIVLIASANLTDYDLDAPTKAELASSLITQGKIEETIDLKRRGKLSLCSGASILFTQELLENNHWASDSHFWKSKEDPKTHRQTIYGTFYLK